VIIVFGILGVVALVVVVLFSVQNATPVTVSFYNFRFDASLAIVVFLSALAGMVIETLFVVSLRLRRSMKRRTTRKATKAEEGVSPPEEKVPDRP
jgi:uncharacterized integral membrane protein